MLLTSLNLWLNNFRQILNVVMIADGKHIGMKSVLELSKLWPQKRKRLMLVMK